MRNQKGFGAVEGLLILILISILGFTGYYVYHTRNNTNSTYNKVGAASNAASSSSTIPSEKTLNGAAKQGQEVYDAATKSTSSNHEPVTSDWGKNNVWAALDLQFINAHKNWFTDRYVSSVNNVADNQLDGSGGFLECVNAMFDTMTVKGDSISGDSATLTVTENGRSVKTFPVHLKYQSGNWLVDIVDLSGCS